jgi:hypothetical protein
MGRRKIYLTGTENGEFLHGIGYLKSLKNNFFNYGIDIL